MTEDRTCPSAEELRALIDGSLSIDLQSKCTDHLDTCTCCQTKLESIATEGSNITKIVERLQDIEPMATSAYWPALSAISSGSGQAVAAKPAARARSTALEFLQPPSDPAFLGRLAQFDVMRVIGRGGMGIVLEAFDSRLQRNVALKMLAPELADDEVAKQRFCRESRAAASISHENVVAVHHVEKASEDSLPYLVMQLVTGESLEQRLKRDKKLPIREVIRIGMQAAQGLAAAHAQGLIHRDIKPGNILLEQPSDRVKLTDFGLVRVADDMKLTHTGFISGTPLYMSPEQALGGPADARSDLFSLGAVLYEMCTGQPPFPGGSPLVILKQLAESRHRPLSEANPEVPGWLATTIDRLLAKKPDDRIQTAADLGELFEFEWALLKTNSGEVPTVCEEEYNRTVRRGRMMAVAAGAASLAIGLLAGMFLMPHRGPVAVDSAVAPSAVLTSGAGGIGAVAFNPAGDTVAAAVDDGTLRLWDVHGKSVSRTLSAHRGAISAALFSENGDFLATAGDDGLVKLWNPSQPESLKVFAHPNAVRGLVLSHDGQSLFAGDSGGNLRLWSIKNGESTAEIQQPGAVGAIALAPNDETLATGGSDQVVRLWNAKNLTQKLLLEGHVGPIDALSFHPDGRRLASAGWDKTIRIWDAGSGQLITSWHGHDGEIQRVVYSPGGTMLATGGADGIVKVWNAESGELLATHGDHNFEIQSLTFSNDGRQLAAGSDDGAVRLWSVD